MDNKAPQTGNNLHGEWRQPINVWANLPNSIHNEEVAAKLGIRSATIPGTLHFNMFPPLFIKLWGEKWFENGGISMYYTYATGHREEVRAVLSLPPKNAVDVQVEAWIESLDGHIVAKGTVSLVQPRETSYVRSLELPESPRGEMRILSGFTVGEELGPRENVTVTTEMLDKHLETITDPIDWYKKETPWGERILPPRLMYEVMTVGFPDGRIPQSVGFFGATDIQLIHGPIKARTKYRVTGRVVGLGVSPKTEFMWVDSQLYDADNKTLIGNMRHMTRWMKASSPLWVEKINMKGKIQ